MRPVVDGIFPGNAAGSISGDFTTSSVKCIPGDLDGVGDYDEADVHLTGDADGDGDVDAEDRTAVNDALGLSAADIDGDGVVIAFDLATVLGYWGLCSAP
ncbi:MAG: hypothetical protein CMJ51_00910 [Planctomycetaceae bacterium]|nr:hypothetical protein [Planctomycetaceae bacterium]